jgi:hypothetical protein
MAIKGSKYQSLEVLEYGSIGCNERDINKGYNISKFFHENMVHFRGHLVKSLCA